MTQSPSKPIIGIVGGVGAGKSTVAAAFAELGCARIDGDAIGHELLDEPDVRRRIHDRWGERVFADGGVDRRELGRIVFADADELAALNAILHPRIRTRMESLIAAAMDDGDVPGVAIDAAVLFEAGWDDLCTHVVFVEASADERFQRVRESRGWDERTWRRVENSQIPLDIKAAKCDYSIVNSPRGSHLKQQARRIFDQTIHATGRS